MTDITPKYIFETRVPQRLTDQPELQQSFNMVLLFDITGPNGGKWVLDLTRSSDWVSTNTEGVAPKTIIEISDTDFVSLITKKLNPQAAVMTGKLKLKPMNVAVGMKLGRLFS